MKIRKTPLNRIHRKLGGRMVEFAGWEMPVQYHSALEEHLAVRQRVGVFDVSHMGQIDIRGKGAMAFVQRVTCNDVSKVADGQAQYSAFLTPEGTFIDDLVVYRFDSERFLLCVNAATKDKDFAWLMQCPAEQTEIVDKSDTFAQIAVQGPKAVAVLQHLTKTDLSAIRNYWFAEGSVVNVPAIISRTGYTGEDGFELYISSEDAEAVWDALFDVGQAFEICPAGLAARNTLRLEMKYPLYGRDIDDTRTPLEAGLGWIVKLDKDFIGRDRLAEQKAQGVENKLVGFEMVDPGIVRDDYGVILEGNPVGKVCSGGFAPSLKKSIGLAYLPAGQSSPEQPLEIDLRGRLRAAKVVKTPFYKRER